VPFARKNVQTLPAYTLPGALLNGIQTDSNLYLNEPVQLHETFSPQQFYPDEHGFPSVSSLKSPVLKEQLMHVQRAMTINVMQE